MSFSTHSVALRQVANGPGRVLPLIALVACIGCTTSDPEADANTGTRSDSPARTTLTVGTIHHGETAGAEGEPAIRSTLSDGAEIAVERAHVVISAVEFHACLPGVDEFESPDGPTLNGIWDGFVPPARAHVTSSSNRLGTPAVEALTYDFDSAQILGEIAPPAGAYCRIAVIVAPADPDVVNSTRLSTDDIVGHSIVIEGRRRPSPDEEWEPFTWRSSASRVFTFPALDPQSGDSPLVLAPDDGTSMLLADKTVTSRTFAVAPDAEDPAAAVLERLGDTMEVYTF